ncbi:putative DNA-binding domain-containing protein [Aquabacterium sp. A08]|uniref:HvfC/BufC family peptide modification chaperone n=1 Tax=Aquabacterium sp. A08 TaxID=2718532 RepID=UPI0014223B02|nr:DUF2063 domain-containing protein [Aquabacterium sp. A08]
MSAGFYDYVRGRSDAVPAGYTEAGLRAYRHLVYLGASQMIASHHPALRQALDDGQWRFLIEDFVRQSAWTSNYYADLVGEFEAYLARVSA